MARLFQHVLQQRHMYPVFPPAPQSCVDFAHTAHLALPHLPDVLVLPSPFPPCAKVVQTEGGASAAGVLSRQHLCAFFPCSVGAPLHAAPRRSCFPAGVACSFRRGRRVS
jgi:hypothetical protein